MWTPGVRTVVVAMALVAALFALGCTRSQSGDDVTARAHIAYSETGGLGGISKSVSVSGDGRVTVTSGASDVKETTFGVEQEKVQKLVSVLEQAGYFSYEDEYAPVRPVPDSLTERVTYEDGQRVKEVTVVTGAQPPGGWDEIVRQIRALESSAAPVP